MTPQQRDELLSVGNVHGCGASGIPFYRVSLSKDGWTRVQELTYSGVTVPVWYYLPEGESRYWVLTEDPIWFVELEEKINAARVG